MSDKIYSYERFGSKGVRVGQAVHDIISKEQPTYTAEEILEEMGKGILSLIQDEAENGCKRFDGTFYLLHIFKKGLPQFGVENVMLQSAKCFETKFSPKEVMEAHPNAAKTLYEVNKKSGTITLMWTVPGKEDCISIKKNPHLYDRDLVKWVDEATSLCG